eukprot:PhF_6_TR41314/c0_g1_i3/m.62577
MYAPASHVSLPPLVIPYHNPQTQANNTPTEAIGDWVFKLGGGTSAFGRTSWKKRFVVADPVGIFYFPQQEAYTTESMHKAKGFRLYRACEYFVTCFASDPADVGLDTLVDPKTNISVFHPMACEGDTYHYFGFIPKHPDVNPSFVLRTESKAIRDKYVNYIACVFNPPKIKPMLLPPSSRGSKALPSGDNVTTSQKVPTVTRATSPIPSIESSQPPPPPPYASPPGTAREPGGQQNKLLLEIASQTTEELLIPLYQKKALEEEKAKESQRTFEKETENVIHPALPELTSALTAAHDQISRLMEDITTLKVTLEKSEVERIELRRHIAGLEAQRDMRTMSPPAPPYVRQFIQYPRDASVQCNMVHPVTSKGNTTPPPPPPPFDLDEYADNTITALRQQIARVTLERDSLTVSVSRLHKKFESCLSAFCEKVIHDMDMLSSETKYVDSVWRDRLRQMQRGAIAMNPFDDNTTVLDVSGGDVVGGGAIILTLQLIEDTVNGSTKSPGGTTIRSVVTADKKRLHLVHVEDGEMQEDGVRFDRTWTFGDVVIGRPSSSPPASNAESTWLRLCVR